jgi:hypothetical protein
MYKNPDFYSNSFLVPFFFIILFTISSCQTSGDSTKNENNKSESGSSNESDGFSKIFDGETLNGWEGDTNLWRVENGNLVGEITPATVLEKNSFIIWRDGKTDDFELKLEYKISKEGNSGVNYRSEEVEDVPFALRGYQADIDGRNQWTGQNYEERGRAIIAFRGQKVTLNPISGSVQSNVKNNVWTGSNVTENLGDRDSLTVHINEDWNEMHIIARGNHLQHYVNGVLMADITDNDTINRKDSGLLGVQVHVGPPMRTEFRNIRFKEL